MINKKAEAYVHIHDTHLELARFDMMIIQYLKSAHLVSCE
jgi:hypothetical protein